jgi:hypothetical protein
VALVAAAAAVYWFGLRPLNPDSTTTEALTGTQVQPRQTQPPQSVTNPPAASSTPVAAAATAAISNTTTSPVDTVRAPAVEPPRETSAPPVREIASAPPISNPPIEGGPLVPPWPRSGQPFTNGLGMRFLPVKDSRILLAIWETRVSDYAVFEQAVNATGDRRWKSPGFEQSPNHPVVFVSWANATNFCGWLTRTERAGDRLGPNQRYRLPADLEWSQAVGLADERGDTPSDRGRLNRSVAAFAWGTEFPPATAVANLRGLERKQLDRALVTLNIDDGYAHTAPVGSFPPGVSGLLDIAGNVLEWCSDPPGRVEGNRVVRGGSWDSFREDDLRLTFRDDFSMGTRLDRLGFRCVLDPGP